jgi:hypothetical protein
MSLPRWPIQWRRRPGPDGSGQQVRPAPPPPPDISPECKRLVRVLERKKRLFDRLPPPRHCNGPLPRYFERATHVSFRLDGLHTTETEISSALASGAAARACRSRCAQRVRNHVAALHHVERLLRRNLPLHAAHVIRWYASVACGLSYGRIDDQTSSRVERIVSTLNSPQLRLRPAVQEITALHVRLLADPFVPGFNGIIARLLLRYHLGRCALPPVMFDPDTDGARLGSEAQLLPRLTELLAQSYDEWLKE